MFPDVEVSSDYKSWASLLGLLSPSEYFVTVDHSVLWQKHVAWSKPKGENLRKYVTERFASNMIVLSLMLGAEIGVFFNSAAEVSEMRMLLNTARYGSLRYWIGIIIALDCSVTVIAIIATFTLWGMISAISDNNTHALLRSSIGQYVISLPPRLVVGALYLFMLWLVLFFISIVSGPLRVVLALIILSLFFQVVVPLSAFGRLIIHTGSMAKRRVLEEEFEKELLPSGLHAALLIRAHDRRRKYTSAIHQYRKKTKTPAARAPSESDYSKYASRSDNIDSNNVASSNIDSNQDANSNDNTDQQDKQQGRLDSQDERQILATARLLGYGPRVPSIASASPSPLESQPRARRGHNRTASADSTGSNNFLFPRASFLNTTGSHDLNSIVKNTLSERGGDPSDLYLNDDPGVSHTKGVSWGNSSSTQKSEVPPITISFNTSNLVSPLQTGRKKMLPPFGPPRVAPPHPSKRTSSARHSLAARRKSSLLSRQASSRKLLDEWEEEEEVRDLYDLPPPAELLVVDDEEEETPEEVTQSHRRRMPRASMMNRVRNLASLRSLISRETIHTPDSSISGDECMEENDRLLGRIEEGSNRKPVSEVSGLLSSGRSSGTRDSLDGRNSDRG